MSYKSVDTRARGMSQPLGFYSYKADQCYKACVPPPNNGTHVNLHMNLSPRFRRSDTVKDPRAYSQAFQLIYKQRRGQQVFTAQAPTKCYTEKTTTRKLATYDPTRHPPGSTTFPHALYFPQVVCNKPLYSKAEVQEIVNRLYQRKHTEGRCPPRIQLDKTRKTFPAEMVDDIVDIYGSTNRLCTNPKHRNRTRDQMYAQKVLQDLQNKKGDVDAFVKRLNSYDKDKWPPNSKGSPSIEPGSPEPILYPPKHTSMSEREVDELVDRLHTGRWKSPSPGRYDTDDEAIDEEENQKQEEIAQGRETAEPGLSARDDKGYESDQSVHSAGDKVYNSPRYGDV